MTPLSYSISIYNFVFDGMRLERDWERGYGIDQTWLLGRLGHGRGGLYD